MSKNLIKTLVSPLGIFCVAIVLAMLFLVHFVHFSTQPESHAPDKVIDMLRSKKIVFTNSEKITDPADSSTIPLKKIDDVLLDKTTSNQLLSEQKSQSADESIHLPGGSEHRILGLSDAQFRSIPVSEMFSWYGEADGGGTCAKDFGNELITRWRDTQQTYCAAEHPVSSHPAAESGKESDGNLNSFIDCYLVRQTRHHGGGDNLCHMHNVAVDLGLFAEDAHTRPVVKTYVDTHHNKQPYVKFPRGFIEGDCTPDPHVWQASTMPGWNYDLTVGAYQPVSTLPATHAAGEHTEGSASVCHEWIDHPVLITERDTFANFFHDSEDFFNVFIAMAVLQWKPQEVQMYLTDLYPKGPFWEMWSKVFSQGNEDVTVDGAMTAMTAWDLRQRFASTPKGKKICFRDIAVGIFGPAAPMTVASWDTPCSKTALVRAYSDYVIRGLGMQGHTRYASATPSDTIVITYMARRPSKEWPEKKYCDSKNSFFLCELWQNFGERKLGRMIHNDAEVVAALKGLEKEKLGNAKNIVVRDVDYNVLTFEQQIATDLETDIMIGPHGAGLMHNIFMPDRAALIELFVDGSGVNRHFHNLAFWFGRQYHGVTIHNPIKIPELLNIVRRAVVSINVNKY